MQVTKVRSFSLEMHKMSFGADPGVDLLGELTTLPRPPS